MKKRILNYILVFVMLLSSVPCIVRAEIVDSGEYGWLKWMLDNKKILTISGDGNIPDCSYDLYDIPWFYKRHDIKKIVIQHGVTGIGGYAFA